MNHVGTQDDSAVSVHLPYDFRERQRESSPEMYKLQASGFAGGYLRVPSMFDSLEVKVLFTA